MNWPLVRGVTQPSPHDSGERLQLVNQLDLQHNPRPACSRLPISSSTHLTGMYEVNCRVTDHFAAGMRERYRVDLCAHRKINHTQASNTVQYFISAEEVEWDYSEERVWELEKHHATLKDRCV